MTMDNMTFNKTIKRVIKKEIHYGKNKIILSKDTTHGVINNNNKALFMGSLKDCVDFVSKKNLEKEDYNIEYTSILFVTHPHIFIVETE